jgi:uncharacterized membrane protein YedE/YeeE
MKGFVAFLSGLMFSGGLLLSGMTQPRKVMAFLDVSGAWDPSLALVMVGAIAVSAVAFWASTRLRTPVLDRRFRLPPSQGVIEARLVVGAILFGIGWGLSALCPGPAVVLVATGTPGAIAFVASMLGGMVIQGWVAQPSDLRGSASATSR